MIKPLITSADNRIIKLTASLEQKKYRAEHGLFVVEGANIISNIPDTYAVEYYIVIEGKLPDYARLLRDNVDIYPVTPSIFNKISDTESPQGILAVLKIPAEGIADGSDFCLILDRISDAGNMGAIIRTAAASGFGDIYCIGCTDAYSPKAVRSSMGGIFFCNIIDAGYDIADGLKIQGYAICAADINGTNIFGSEAMDNNAGILKNKAEIQKTKTVLIIGSEAHGIDGKLKAAADNLYTIPMVNVESLNAAVAAGIMMYRLKNTGADK